MACLLVCAALALGACAAKGTAAAPKNGAGTIAVSVSDDALQAEAQAEAQANAAPADENSAAANASGATGTTADPSGVSGTAANSSGADSAAGLGDSAAVAPGADASGESISAAPADGKIFDIGEKMFVGQMNDIYANTDDYIGKTIRYEGFFTSYTDDRTGAVYNCIVRNGPGCCGYDSVVGFEFDWNGAMPKADDWCRITGKVGVYKEDGFDYIQIKAQDLEVLPVRGNDTVMQ